MKTLEELGYSKKIYPDCIYYTKQKVDGPRNIVVNTQCKVARKTHGAFPSDFTIDEMKAVLAILEEKK